MPETDWDRIVALYDLLMQQSPSPVVALNRALAVAERDGVDEGRRALMALADDRKLSTYPFYWAARADLDSRGSQRAVLHGWHAPSGYSAGAARRGRATSSPPQFGQTPSIASSAVRADLERRAERHVAARSSYERAIALARSAAECVSYERRLELLVSGS